MKSDRLIILLVFFLLVGVGFVFGNCEIQVCLVNESGSSNYKEFNVSVFVGDSLIDNYVTEFSDFACGFMGYDSEVYFEISINACNGNDNVTLIFENQTGHTFYYNLSESEGGYTGVIVYTEHPNPNGINFYDYSNQHKFLVNSTAKDSLYEITSCEIITEQGDFNSINLGNIIEIDDENWRCLYNVSTSILPELIAGKEVNITVKYNNSENYSNTIKATHTLPNQPPDITSINILPSLEANSNENLNCSFTYYDAEDDDINVTFNWFNGTNWIDYNNQTLPSSYTLPGQSWNCSVNITDGLNNSGIFIEYVGSDYNISNARDIIQIITSFIITLPNNNETNSTNATSELDPLVKITPEMLFSVDSINYNMKNACVINPDSSEMCQDFENPFFKFENTGNVNLDWFIRLNDSLSTSHPGLKLFYNDENDVATAIDISSQTSFLEIYSNIDVGGKKSLWFWGNFSNVMGGTEVTRTLYHKGNLTS